MGIFDIFKGGKPSGGLSERDRQMMANNSRQAEVKTAEQKRSLAVSSERVFPSRSTPEAREAPRTVHLYRRKYGKTVQSPGGPIVPGLDYHTTGVTPGLDWGGKLFIPSQKLFNDDQDSASVFYGQGRRNDKGVSWMDEGGAIIKKTLADSNGKLWVVCVRRNFLNESGRGGPTGKWSKSTDSGRWYGSCDYLAIPFEEWSVALVPQLDHLLSTEPMSKADSRDLPIVEANTEILDQPLPEGWCSDQVRDVLFFLLSGRPVALEIGDIEIKKILETYFYVLICLPEQVSRQLSFGSGLNVTDKIVQLGHGLYANGSSSIKYSKGAWSDSRAKNDRLAHVYLNFIDRCIERARTPRELMSLVLKTPPSVVGELEKRFSNQIV